MPEPQHHKQTMNSWIRSALRLDVVLCVLLVGATLCVYGQMWTHEFIGYDDDRYVTQNRFVRQGLSREGVSWALSSIHASNWHPVTWLSHMLDVELYGLNAGGHVLTNVLFHSLNALLLLFLFHRPCARSTGW